MAVRLCLCTCPCLQACECPSACMPVCIHCLCFSVLCVCVCVCVWVRSEELRQSHAASVEQMERYEAKHMGGFQRIFPREGGEKYDKYFKHSSSLFQETAASKAREACARYGSTHPHTHNHTHTPTPHDRAEHATAH